MKNALFGQFSLSHYIIWFLFYYILKYVSEYKKINQTLLNFFNEIFSGVRTANRKETESQ